MCLCYGKKVKCQNSFVVVSETYICLLNRNFCYFIITFFIPNKFALIQFHVIFTLDKEFYAEHELICKLKNFAATFLMPTRLRSLLDYNWNIMRQRISVYQQRFFFPTKNRWRRSNSFCVSPSSLNETIPYRHALTKFFVKQNLPLSSQSPYKETDVAGMRHAGSSQQNLINHTETDVFCMYHYIVQVFQVSPIYLHLLKYKV